MEPLDTIEVEFEGSDDQEHPRNWTASKKNATVAIVTVMAFVAPLSTSMLAPGVPQLMEEFNSANAQLSTFVVSVYILGLAIGPLFLGPLSEIHGRSIVYKFASIFFFACMIACALAPNLVALIVFRFLSGCAGAVASTNGGGTIADLYVADERGSAMAWIGMGTLFGPVIGPILGGFVTQALGWRWTFWLLAIVSGVAAVVMVVFLPETYPDQILQIKARKLRKSTDNIQVQARASSQAPPITIFTRAIVRPVKLLFNSFVIFGLSLYLALIYGEMYVLFTTYPEVFSQQYQFTPNAVGLSYLGLGVGLFIGAGLVQRYSDKVSRRMTAKSGFTKPEYRLLLLFCGAPATPFGLVLYGWTAENKIHWIVPIIASSLIGFGLVLTFLTVNLYTIDAYTKYAASALAATSFLRNLVGGSLPLAGLSLYEGLGLGWGNSLLGLITLAVSVLPILIYRYGDYMRQKCPIDL